LSFFVQCFYFECLALFLCSAIPILFAINSMLFLSINYTIAFFFFTFFLLNFFLYNIWFRIKKSINSSLR
jgi:low affinity Fe/Cu permease